MKKSMKTVFCSLMLALCSVAGRGQMPPRGDSLVPEEKRNPVRVPKFDKAPVIDGSLGDEAWQSAAVLKDFYQTQPGDNIAPSKQTDVLLGYDSHNFYIAFKASDEGGRVRATVPKRDAIFADDNVGVYLDTFNDQRKAYQLFFNPIGVQADAVFTEGRGEDFSVDIVMESKGVVSESGYVVEVRIPFKSLRYEAGKGKLWGIHVFRQIKRLNDEQDSWMPLSRNRSGLLNQAGHITGLEELARDQVVEIIPSLTLSETGQRVRTIPSDVAARNPALLDPGRFVNLPFDGDPGLTAKLGITPTITLDFALNPDFAQIESDQLVVTANQRFPIFFEEKRPFFLEGIDVFRTLLNTVHTRTIIDPDYAVKLTGKQGRNTFGFLLASDNGPGNFDREEINDPLLRPRIERFIDRNAHVGVVRLKRDVGRESNVGMIATFSDFVERHNYVGGFDGRLRLDPKTVFSFQAVGTTSRRFFFSPDQGRNVYRTGNGFGYSWALDRTGRHFSYSLLGDGRTRYYRADVGFTQRVDTNLVRLNTRYSSEPDPKARLISWRMSNILRASFDWRARMQTWIEQPQLSFTFRRQTFLNIGAETRHERVFEEEFGARRSATRAGAFIGPDPERSAYRGSAFVTGSTTPSEKYSLTGFLSYTMGELDFDRGALPRFPRVSPAALLDPDAPLDPGPGNTLDASLGLVFQPTAELRTSLDYTKSKLVRNDTGRVAFDDNIYSWRTTYQFTRFVFARARVDYSSLQTRALGQFLVGWTPNPGTAFYAGYNNNINHNGFSPFTGQFEPGFRRTGQVFFVKASYLFRRSF